MFIGEHRGCQGSTQHCRRQLAGGLAAGGPPGTSEVKGSVMRAVLCPDRGSRLLICGKRAEGRWATAQTCCAARVSRLQLHGTPIASGRARHQLQLRVPRPQRRKRRPSLNSSPTVDGAAQRAPVFLTAAQQKGKSNRSLQGDLQPPAAMPKPKAAGAKAPQPVQEQEAGEIDHCAVCCGGVQGPRAPKCIQRLVSCCRPRRYLRSLLSLEPSPLLRTCSHAP